MVSETDQLLNLAFYSSTRNERIDRKSRPCTRINILFSVKRIRIRFHPPAPPFLNARTIPISRAKLNSGTRTGRYRLSTLSYPIGSKLKGLGRSFKHLNFKIRAAHIQ